MSDKIEKKPMEKPEPKLSAIDKKKRAIMSSKMPQWQKDEYLAKLRGRPASEKRVAFNVYARVKNLKDGFKAPMLAYPAAKGVESATVQEWDKLFKDFF